MKKFIKKTRDSLLGLDLYGHPIAVNFRGQSTYQTWLGVTCSLLVYAIVFQSLITLSTVFIDGSRQDEKVNVVNYDRFDSKAYNLKDYGITFYIFPYNYRSVFTSEGF